jgi:Domain of unknown function (DUF1990)
MLRPRRLYAAVRWPVGIALTAWSYTWRTTPIHRRELEGEWPHDGPPSIDAALLDDDVQRPQDGVGPLFRRRYTARIRDGRIKADEMMNRVQREPNRVAPGRVAHFEKLTGDDENMRVGDEYVAHMPGPWDGPIRVVEVTPRSFRFVTLAGHLEAGQIEWRAADDGDDLVFEIESWARAGDRLSHVLHDRLGMAKEVQLYMWTSVLERAAREADGHLAGGIEIETRRAEIP